LLLILALLGAVVGGHPVVDTLFLSELLPLPVKELIIIAERIADADFGRFGNKEDDEEEW